MANTTQYINELEALIIDRLLPVYIEHQKSINASDPYAGINKRLIQDIKSHKKVAALLKPKEISS